MFTSVPVSVAVDAMYEHLVKSGITLDAAEEFEKLILLCTDQNVCSFDGKTFKFPTGLPMGGPLSSLVDDVLIERLERWALKISKYSHHAIFWYRYVDDILCI